MATKVVDAAAAKRRQQKIILIVGGVLLVGLMAIQGPKLLKHGSSSSAAAPAATTAGTTAGTVTPTVAGTTPAVVVVTKGGQSTQVAGVVLRTAGAPAAGAAQLWSLSRFKVKDPFVQQVGDSTSGTSAAPSTAGTGASPSATTGSSTGSVVTPSTSTPVAYAYATLIVNGKPQQLTLKQVFPKGQPTFVLQAVGKNFVKIGVAGGKFTGGEAVKLMLGERVTLMNTATGQRFVMKLAFTGTEPEQIAGFNAPGSAVATTPATTAPVASTGTTTATPGLPGATP